MRAELADILEAAVTARAFPGGVVWLARGAEVLAHEAHGATAYAGACAQPVTRATLYDIASLTKLFTATALLVAARAAGVAMCESLARFLPEYSVPDKSAITLRHLLNHSSGIAIAVQSLVDVPAQEWLNRIAAAPLRTPIGSEVHYSCTNYFLLARVVEALSGQLLHRFIEAQILEPLDMARTTFWPLQKFDRGEIAPTEIKAATGEYWHGVVHDEAARAWSTATATACGNSGLFSTAGDLARFAQLWLDAGACGQRQILAAQDVRSAFNDVVREENHGRGWCWQIDAAFYMSHAAPRGSAGHTGFTGPTLFLNPTTRHVAIILENRVCPTRHGPNRMGYHRRIAEWLLQSLPEAYST
ncbi:MAG TPA: serine hydrolase domain-containing protein [Abditibacteriaceae bacterium]|nr:serine hydrolase domain-containing protein [Abditibacteriaceae bacterium]